MGRNPSRDRYSVRRMAPNNNSWSHYRNCSGSGGIWPRCSKLTRDSRARNLGQLRCNPFLDTYLDEPPSPHVGIMDHCKIEASRSVFTSDKDQNMFLVLFLST